MGSATLRAIRNPGADGRGDSVTSFVFHNDDLLFDANGNGAGGADGGPTTLSEADGFFQTENLSLALVA